MKVTSTAQFNRNQLLQPVIHPASSAPSAPATGQVYWNTSSKTFNVYDGTAWVPLADASSVSTVNDKIQILQADSASQAMTLAVMTTAGTYSLGVSSPWKSNSIGFPQPVVRHYGNFRWLVGSVSRATAGVDGTAVIIPNDTRGGGSLRPPVRFMSACASSNGVSRVDLHPDGRVVPQGSFAVDGWVSFNVFYVV